MIEAHTIEFITSSFYASYHIILVNMLPEPCGMLKSIHPHETCNKSVSTAMSRLKWPNLKAMLQYIVLAEYKVTGRKLKKNIRIA